MMFRGFSQEESSNISQITRMGIAYRFQEGKVIVNHNRFLSYTKYLLQIVVICLKMRYRELLISVYLSG